MIEPNCETPEIHKNCTSKICMHISGKLYNNTLAVEYLTDTELSPSSLKSNGETIFQTFGN